MKQICKYYLNSMVISCCTCKKEEKECKHVKHFIYVVLSQFQICRNLRVSFSQICIPKISKFTTKWFFPSLPATNPTLLSRFQINGIRGGGGGVVILFY